MHELLMGNYFVTRVVLNSAGLGILRQAAKGRAPQEGRMPATGAARVSTGLVDAIAREHWAKVARLQLSQLLALRRVSE